MSFLNSERLLSYSLMIFPGRVKRINLRVFTVLGCPYCTRCSPEIAVGWHESGLLLNRIIKPYQPLKDRYDVLQVFEYHHYKDKEIR
jgi:hypothetical protein